MAEAPRESIAGPPLQLVIVLLVVVYAAASVPLSGATTGAWTRFGAPDDSSYLIADVAIGFVLLAAALGRWIAAGPSVSVIAGVTVALLWLLPVVASLRGSPLVLRVAAVATEPMLLPAAIVSVTWVGGRRRDIPFGQALLVAPVVVGAVLGLLRALSYDPFFELDCSVSCAHVPAIFEVGASGRYVLLEAIAGFEVIAAAALAGQTLWVVIRGIGSTQRDRAVVTGAFIVGASAGSLAALRVLALVGSVDEFGATLRFAREAMLRLLDIGMLTVGAAILASTAGVLRARLRFHRAAEAIADAPTPGTLRATLAGVLDDPDLEIDFWSSDDGRLIDPDGRAIAIDVAGRRATEIMSNGRPMARVIHRADLDAEAVTREIGRSMLVAIDNERLQAESRGRLAELRASRARVVRSGDAERRRLERDLHDGAQQRLLAIMFELRLARLAAERAGDAARAGAVEAIEVVSAAAVSDLRRLARGIHPAVLTDAGLADALGSLTDDAPMPVSLAIDEFDPLPADTEAAAYYIAVEAIAEAAARGAHHLSLRVDVRDAALRMEFRDDAEPPSAVPLRLMDRAGAAGGDADVGRDAVDRGSLLSVALPCA